MNYQKEVVVISINSDFKIDEQYWYFKGLIFEDLKSGFSKLNFTGTNNTFNNCVFRTSGVDFFDGNVQQNNQFKFCKIEN
jgi:hypothetical protein